MSKVTKIKCFWDQDGTEYVQTEWSTPTKPGARKLLALRCVFKGESLVTVLDKRTAHKLIEALEDFMDS